jgi:hypothetical protein
VTHIHQRLKQIACALCGSWITDRRRMKQTPAVCEDCERKREQEKLATAEKLRASETAIDT